MDGTNVHVLPTPAPGQIWLITGPSLATQLLLDLGARLACDGPVRFLDGGNRFNAYLYNRLAARRQHHDLTALLHRTRIARAFTCYQVLTLLAETPASPAPTLVLDLLSTFYDENVPLPEALRLLDACLVHLRRLSTLAPVAVSVRVQTGLRTALGPLQEDRTPLLDTLTAAAGRVWPFEPAIPVNPQTDFLGRI